jgi:hypothetical protein
VKEKSSIFYVFVEKDRFGAFLLFLFGFMLTALFFDETGPYSAGEWGSISLLFLIAFCFMWLYYNDRVDDERHGCVHPLERNIFLRQIWQACHLPLAMALIIMADASVRKKKNQFRILICFDQRYKLCTIIAAFLDCQTRSCQV